MLTRRIFMHHGAMATAVSITAGPMTDPGGEIGRGDPSVSKSQADYQVTPNHGQACAACCMFVPGAPAHCTMIRGVISPRGWCVYWEAGPPDSCS